MKLRAKAVVDWGNHEKTEVILIPKGGSVLNRFTSDLEGLVQKAENYIKNFSITPDRFVSFEVNENPKVVVYIQSKRIIPETRHQYWDTVKIIEGGNLK